MLRARFILEKTDVYETTTVTSMRDGNVLFAPNTPVRAQNGTLTLRYFFLHSIFFYSEFMVGYLHFQEEYAIHASFIF